MFNLPLLRMGVLLVALASYARATMIVFIYTNDGYWIASDSYRSSGGKHVSDVCKIHETRLGLLVKSGDSQGETTFGGPYSTDKEVEDLVSSSESLKDLKESLRARFKQDINREIAILVDDPQVTGESLEQMPMRNQFPEDIVSILSRVIVIFDTASPEATGEVLLVEPQSGRVFPNSLYKYGARAVFGWHPADQLPYPSYPVIHTAPSIHQLSYMVSYGKSEAWVQLHPKETIVEMLTEGHKEHQEEIGPPYAIVHVIVRKSQAPKVKWVSKGVCPQWSESVDPSAKTLIQLRDELRKHANSSSP